MEPSTMSFFHTLALKADLKIQPDGKPLKMSSWTRNASTVCLW